MASDGSYDPNVWAGDGGNGAAENHEHYSHQQTQEPSTSSAVPQFVPGDSPEDDADSGEYDPESVIISTTVTPVPTFAAAPPPTANTSSPRPAKKPKKAGGFIVGSSDDEDDTSVPESSANLQSQLVTAVADGPARAFTRSPLQQATTSTNIAPTPQVSNGEQSDARPPTDIVSTLEDRIKHDPRGGMDAWLALIDETRRRNVVQDSRSIYERFLQNFPQSVRA